MDGPLNDTPLTSRGVREAVEVSWRTQWCLDSVRTSEETRDSRLRPGEQRRVSRDPWGGSVERGRRTGVTTVPPMSLSSPKIVDGFRYPEEGQKDRGWSRGPSRRSAEYTKPGEETCHKKLRILYPDVVCHWFVKFYKRERELRW